MSISPLVDAGYRLQPADLEGASRQVVIANVTYQGVEEMTPVLHFAGQTKRLVLSPQHVEQVIKITGTTLFQQWIGATLVLQPRITKNDSAIWIHAAGPGRRARPMPVYVSEDKRGWYLALSVVGLLILASVIYFLINGAAVLEAVELLRDYLSLR
jgi:hypothetical protein